MSDSEALSPNPMPAVSPGPQGVGGPADVRMWALIPCAGSGARARAVVPKQYQMIAGRALVLHTLAAFDVVPRIATTLVVLSPGDEFLASCGATGRWSTVACGGATRAQTVAHGLAELQRRGAADGDWVLVHDAARCLLTPELIDRLIDACQFDAVGGLLAHPVADTLKRAAGNRVAETIDRSTQWLAQTPQMFRIATLRGALLAAGDRVTDDASAIEYIGLAPLIVPGSAQNFKVTFPEDFLLAQSILLARAVKPNTQDLAYDYP